MSKFDDYLKFQLFNHIVMGDNSKDNFFHESDKNYNAYDVDSDLDDYDSSSDDWDDYE